MKDLRFKNTAELCKWLLHEYPRKKSGAFWTHFDLKTIGANYEFESSKEMKSEEELIKQTKSKMVLFYAQVWSDGTTVKARVNGITKSVFGSKVALGPAEYEITDKEAPGRFEYYFGGALEWALGKFFKKGR